MIDINEIRRRIQFMRENKISDPFAFSLEEMEWVCEAATPLPMTGAEIVAVLAIEFDIDTQHPLPNRDRLAQLIDRAFEIRGK